MLMFYCLFIYLLLGVINLYCINKFYYDKWSIFVMDIKYVTIEEIFMAMVLISLWLILWAAVAAIKLIELIKELSIIETILSPIRCFCYNFFKYRPFQKRQ